MHTPQSLADVLERDYFPMPDGAKLYLAEHEWRMVIDALRASPPEAEQPSIETIRLAGAVLDAKDEGWDEALEAAALEAENWEYGETAARKIREMKRLSRSDQQPKGA